MIARLGLLAVLALACAAYLAGLDHPSELYADEIFYVPDGRSYVGLSERPPENFEHPPLGKLGIGVSTYVLGDRPLGWRFFSVASSLLLLILLFVATDDIHRKRRGRAWLLLAPLAALADPALLSSSRIAMLDAPVTVAMFAAALLFLRAMERTELRPEELALAGAVTGLALAIKWTALILFPTFLVASFCRVTDTKSIKLRLFPFFAFLAPIPFVYLGAYLLVGESPMDVFSAQRKMFAYHAAMFSPTVTDASTPLDWLMLQQPQWLDYRGSSEGPRLVAVIPSIVVWPAGYLATLYCLVLGFRRRSAPPLLFAAATLTQLGLWSLGLHQAFLYYMSAVVPFLAMAIVWSLMDWRQRTGTSAPIAAAVLFAALALSWATLCRPIWAGEPLDTAQEQLFFERPIATWTLYRDRTYSDAAGLWRHAYPDRFH